VQIDEPVLVFDLRPAVKNAFKPAYEAIGSVGAAGPQVTLATYFGDIVHNIDVLPAFANIHALHVDLVRHPEQLEPVIKQLAPKQVLSMGVVDGRNVWKNNFQRSIEQLQKGIQALGQDRVVVATSSSLLHVPHTLASEKKLPAEVYQWFSFAVEKCYEVAVIAKAVTEGPASVKTELEANAVAMKSRAESQRTNDPKVKERQSQVTPTMHNRKSGFDNRFSQQKKHLSLPNFPTTTIGSFPQVRFVSSRCRRRYRYADHTSLQQTQEIRIQRNKFTKGEITEAQYEEFIRSEIDNCVQIQDELGLDVYVHGEPERNDMVQYFGERLEGYVFTTVCLRPRLDVEPSTNYSFSTPGFSLTDLAVSALPSSSVTSLVPLR
jgi:5-methyltetrahydropteroyltriglutamate--homocysteine methyltransferase